LIIFIFFPSICLAKHPCDGISNPQQRQNCYTQYQQQQAEQERQRRMEQQDEQQLAQQRAQQEQQRQQQVQQEQRQREEQQRRQQQAEQERHRQLEQQRQQQLAQQRAQQEQQRQQQQESLRQQQQAQQRQQQAQKSNSQANASSTSSNRTSQTGNPQAPKSALASPVGSFVNSAPKSFISKTDPDPNYLKGQCVAWATKVFSQASSQQLSYSGNAGQITANAKKQGFTVTRDIAAATPGSMIVWRNGSGYGHVAAIVSNDAKSKTVVISEDNWGKLDANAVSPNYGIHVEPPPFSYDQLQKRGSYVFDGVVLPK